VKSDGLVFVAVPNTDEFRRVANDWLSALLFQRTGIRIALVGEDDLELFLQRETAVKLDALIRAILHGGRL